MQNFWFKRWKHGSDLAVDGRILLKCIFKEKCVWGDGLHSTGFGHDWRPAIVKNAMGLPWRAVNFLRAPSNRPFFKNNFAPLRCSNMWDCYSCSMLLCPPSTVEARSRNCEKRLLASSCLSVCPSFLPHGTTRLLLDWYSWNMFRYSRKSIEKIQVH